MPIDRVDSLHDRQDAGRYDIKAAVSWELVQERRMAAAQGDYAKTKRRAERQKKRDQGKRDQGINGRLLRPNYNGKLGVRPMDAWKLMSAMPIVKTDSEHVGVIGERLCLRVTVDSTKRNEPAPAATTAGGEGEAEAPDGATEAVDDAPAPLPKTSSWLVALVTDNGDRLGYVAGGAGKAAPARVGAGYLLEAEVIEHSVDSAGRQQTIVTGAVLVPMVGKCVARSTLQKWSESGHFLENSLADTTQRRSVSKRPSSASVRIGESTSLLSTEQIKNPWGRGTAPRDAAGRERPRTADPRVAARERGTRARQEAVQAELSEHKVSSLLGILRQQGEDESVIGVILDDNQPQVAAVKRAAQPNDSSLGGLTASRAWPSTAPKHRARPWSASRPWSAVVGGGFVVSGGNGLVNESECVELLQTVSRPRSAAPRVRDVTLEPSLILVAGARRHSLAPSSLNQTNTGLGVSYSRGGLTSHSAASLPKPNISLRESAAREEKSEARQRALEAQAAAAQLTAKCRAELMALKLSELVKELQAKGDRKSWRDQVNKLLDTADPKAAIIDALIKTM